MLDENEGLWKGPVLKVRTNSGLIVLYYISDNQSPKNWSFQEPSFSSSMRRKKLAGSGNEILQNQITEKGLEPSG